MAKKHNHPSKSKDKPQAETHGKKEHSGAFNYIRRHKIGGGLLALLLASFGGPLNFFGSNPNIFYLPAVILCVCILYFTHEYVTFLKSPRGSRAGAQTTEPVPPSEGPSGTSAQPRPRVRSRFSQIRGDRLKVIIGGNSSIFSLGFPPNKPKPLIHLQGVDLVTAQVRDDKLSIDVHLFNATVNLVGDQLTPLPLMWDWNSDESAIEIVDDKERPMFQMEYQDDRTAVIRGVFVSKNVCLVADDNGLYGGMESPDGTIAKHPLSLMFKYPRWKYLGVRNQ